MNGAQDGTQPSQGPGLMSMSWWLRNLAGTGELHVARSTASAELLAFRSLVSLKSGERCHDRLTISILPVVLGDRARAIYVLPIVITIERLCESKHTWDVLLDFMT